VLFVGNGIAKHATSGTLLATRHDPTKERPPPPYPTPVSFPRIEFLPELHATWNQGSAPNLFQHYSRIRKLSDVSAQHLSILNISLRHIDTEGNNNIEKLFLTNEIADSFLPPLSWLDASSAHPNAQASSRVLSNGKAFPSQQEFSIRCKELRHANEDAYRALTRTPVNGQPSARLAHLRRFWEALDNMAYYWDTSADQYYPPTSEKKPTSENAENESFADDAESAAAAAAADEPRKRVKPNPQQEIRDRGFDLPVGSHPPPVDTALDIRPPEVPGVAAERPAGTYRGNRIGNGAGMPDQFRVDAARAFVEPIAWAFGFTLAAHKRPPVLEIKSLLVPIKLSGTVWRPPNQREKARAGYLEGPVLGISCRSEIEFAEGKADSVLDTLRELGAMLCLAQERAREGETERKPGEGKWWTIVPRWGGGPGGEMGDAITSKDEEIEPGEDLISKELESRGRPTGRGSGQKRKQAIANAWKTLRVGVGFWETRTDYTAVGKSPDADWDEVFLVSCLNHHISILKLRVHDDYLHFLRTGECPEHISNPAWSAPIASRSKWYDLFNVEDRLEAFRLLWGIMGYLARVD
jgi:hypothetical protein